MKVEKFKVLLYLKKSGLDKSGKAPIMGRTHVIGDARIRTGAAQGLGHVFQQIRLDAGDGPCRGSGTAVRGALCGSGGDMLYQYSQPCPP